MTNHPHDILELIYHDRSLDRIDFFADAGGKTRQGVRLGAMLLMGGITLLLGVLAAMGAFAGEFECLLVFGMLWLIAAGRWHALDVPRSRISCFGEEQSTTGSGHRRQLWVVRDHC